MRRIASPTRYGLYPNADRVLHTLHIVTAGYHPSTLGLPGPCRNPTIALSVAPKSYIPITYVLNPYTGSARTGRLP